MNQSPAFLSLEQVHEIHRRALSEFGGLDGVREPGLVQSALVSAENTWWYGGGDWFDIAAAYAFHIAESQAFIDGNKRTGAGAALAFLKCTGINCPRNDDALYEAMIAIAEKRIDKTGLAAVFRRLVKTTN